MTASETAVPAQASAGRGAAKQTVATAGRRLGTSYDGYAKEYTSLLLNQRASHLAETLRGPGDQHHHGEEALSDLTAGDPLQQVRPQAQTATSAPVAYPTRPEQPLREV